MAKLGTAVVDIEPDFTRLNRGIDKATKGANSKFAKLGKAAGYSIAAGGLAAVGVEAKRMFDAFSESEKVTKQTKQVLKSTGGVAKVSAKHVGDLATAISRKTGIDDEAIQSSENLLLTFTNVRNEVGKGNKIFDRATRTVTDMSVALGQDSKSSAIQLGKALNDPVKGITALQRVGVTFTKDQKAQIKALAQSGKRLEAQKIVLRELNKEFGGSAEAQAQPLDKLRVAVGNLEESVGSGLKPVFDAAATSLTNFAIKAGPKVQAFADKVTALFNNKNLTTGEKFQVIGREIGKQLDIAAHKAAEAAPKVALAFVKAWLKAPAWTQLLTAGFLLKRTGAFSAAGSKAGGLFLGALRKYLGGPLARALRGAGETAAANAAEGLASRLPVSMKSRQGRVNSTFRGAGKSAGGAFGSAMSAAALLALPGLGAALVALVMQEAGNEIAKKLGLDTKGGKHQTNYLGPKAPGTRGGGAADGPLTPKKVYEFAKGILGRASGGPVPGSGRGDTVPAMLTPGEYVIRKKVVDAFGPGFFANLNGYAQGGQVQPAQGVVNKVWERVSRMFPGGGGPMPSVSFGKYRDSGLVSNASNKVYLGQEALSPTKGLLSKSASGNYWRDTLIHEFAHARQKAGVRLGSKWELEGGAEAFMRMAAPGIYSALGIAHSPSRSPGNYAQWASRVRKENGLDWVKRGQFASGPGGKAAAYRGRSGASSGGSVARPGAGTSIGALHVHVTTPSGDAPDGTALGVTIGRTIEQRFGGDPRQEP